MAPAEKSNRRSYRRRRRRPRRTKKTSDQKQPAQARQKQASGELPEVFIYTYTIYKALD